MIERVGSLKASPYIYTITSITEHMENDNKLMVGEELKIKKLFFVADYEASEKRDVF